MPSSNLVRREQRAHKQTRLTFDSAEPNSSGGLIPARVRYEGSSISTKKAFNLNSQSHVQLDDEDELFSPGKNVTMVIESPPKLSKHDYNRKLHIRPLSSPLVFAKAKDQVSDNSDYDINRLLSHAPVKAQNKVSDNSDYDINDLTSHTSTRYSSPSFHHQANKHKTKQAFAYDGADSSDGSLPEKHTFHTPAKNTKKSTTILISDSSDDSLIQTSSRVGTKGGKAIKTPVKSNAAVGEGQQKTANARSFPNVGSSSAPVTKKGSSVATSKSKSVAPSQIPEKPKKARITLSGNDSSDEYIVSSTSRRIRGSSKGLSRAGIADDDNDDELPDNADIRTPSKGQRRSNSLAVNVTSDDEDEEPISSHLKRRRSLLNMEGNNDDKEEPISSPLKRRRSLLKMKGNNDEDSDASSPSNRSNLGLRQEVHSSDEKVDQSRRKDKGKARERLDQPRRVTRQQYKRNEKKGRSKAQRALEISARRRLGEIITELTDSESSKDTVQRGLYDHDSDLQVLTEFDDESEDGIEAVRQSLKVKNRNEDDDEFVVDDDEPIGVPTMGLHDIPLQFTHAANKPLKEHFKDAVEWLVQKKINPLFNKDDPLYNQAFKKLDDEVHGYASSKFSSSSWTKEFHHALWARPGYWDGPIGVAERESAGATKCEACNRSHPTTYMIQFTGKAYYKRTLEEIDNDHSTSDEDENSADGAESHSSSSDDGSVNSKGQSIPKESKIWHVGRFCRANAEIAHSLIHWKYALNTWVLEKLAEEKHLESDKLVQREHWTAKKRGRYANRIVDKWEGEGILKSLYGEFKTNLQKARDHKQHRN